MAIANQNAVADARTTYETLVNNALQNARASTAWQSIARRVNGGSSIAHQLIMPGATPSWREFTDERDMGGFRKYTKTIPLRVWHKTIKLKRTDVQYDMDGSTAMGIEQLLGSDIQAIWDKLVFDSLASNPTGIDGVALISDTHPFGSSTTWDNKTTIALSFASFNTERARMRALKDETGEPLNLQPSILVVHPDDEEIALQITGAIDKPISVSTAGAIGGVVGATGITNVIRGMGFTVLVTARIASGDWFIIDPRYAPLAMVVWRDPVTIVLDDMTDPERFKHDDFIYSVEADISVDGAQPWGIAGRIQ